MSNAMQIWGVGGGEGPTQKVSEKEKKQYLVSCVLFYFMGSLLRHSGVRVFLFNHKDKGSVLFVHMTMYITFITGYDCGAYPPNRMTNPPIFPRPHVHSE